MTVKPVKEVLPKIKIKEVKKEGANEKVLKKRVKVKNPVPSSSSRDSSPEKKKSKKTVKSESIANLSINDETSSQDSAAITANDSDPEIELPQRRGNRRRHNKRLFSSENENSTTQDEEEENEPQKTTATSDSQNKVLPSNTKVRKVKKEAAKKSVKLKIKLRKPKDK